MASQRPSVEGQTVRGASGAPADRPAVEDPATTLETQEKLGAEAVDRRAGEPLDALPAVLAADGLGAVL
jgi:hypothetical protein